MLKKVAAGINSAQAKSIEVAVKFEGQKKATYVATAALASSPTDSKVQAIFYYNQNDASDKEFNILAAASAKMPKTQDMFSYKKALNFDTNAQGEMSIKYGQKQNSGAEIFIHGKMDQSKARKDFVRQSPKGKQCMKQMENDNNYLMAACENATIEANTMDRLKLEATYKNVGPKVMNATYQIYDFARYLQFFNVEENWVNPNNKDNKIQLEAQLYPNLQMANLSISTPAVNIEFSDVELGKWSQIISSYNPVVSTADRILSRAFGNQFYRKLP